MKGVGVRQGEPEEAVLGLTGVAVGDGLDRAAATEGKEVGVGEERMGVKDEHAAAAKARMKRGSARRS